MRNNFIHKQYWQEREMSIATPERAISIQKEAKKIKSVTFHQYNFTVCIIKGSESGLLSFMGIC